MEKSTIVRPELTAEQAEFIKKLLVSVPLQGNIVQLTEIMANVHNIIKALDAALAETPAGASTPE